MIYRLLLKRPAGRFGWRQQNFSQPFVLAINYFSAATTAKGNWPERVKNWWASVNELPKAPDGKKLPISLPAADPKRHPGPFESLSGYRRIEYLKKLMGVKDRLYEDGQFKVHVRGTAASPIYIPSQADHRAVGCTGIPQDTHDLMWFRVYVGKTARCPLCGCALQAYDYDIYMEEVDFVVKWINKLTKGIKLDGFEKEYDEYTREDILNIAEDQPESDWEPLRNLLKDHYNSLIGKKDLSEEERGFVDAACNNRFINIPGNLIIHGRPKK